MSQADCDKRWRDRHPDAARTSDWAKRKRWLEKPGIRELEALKRVARYHGITLEQAEERKAVRERRHRNDVKQLEKERW